MKKNVFIVILIIIILGMGGYLVYDKVLSKEEKKETTNEKVVKEEKKEETKTDDTKKTSGGFDSSKALNARDGVVYSLINSESGLDVRYKADENGNMKLYLSYAKDYVSGYGIDTTGVKDYNEVEIISDKKILDVHIGIFGLDVAGTTVLLLMEDGTVEYIPVICSLKNNEFKIYGTFENVEGIVRLLDASSSFSRTVLAQKADGTFYDLNEVLSLEYGKACIN